MARGFGLRARLIGGGGGMPQVGFLGGVAQGINNITQQMAQAQDPAYQQALQLQKLKIQAAQGQLEAQQQERETMAGYGRLGEQMFPEAGTQVPTEAEGPGAGQILGTFAGEPNPNERLQKALWQTGNLNALAAMERQQQALALKAPAEQPMNASTLQTLLPGEAPEVYATLAGLPRGEQLKMITERSQQRREGLAAGRAETAEENRERRYQQTQATGESHFQQTLARLTEAGKKKDIANNIYVDQNNRVVLNPSDQQEGLTPVPRNSESAKAIQPLNTVHNHLDKAADVLERMTNRFGNDKGRLMEYMTHSFQQLSNDPDAVELFNFLHGPNAIAVTNLYAGGSTGMRSSARLAYLLEPSSIQKGDSLETAIKSKLMPMSDLNYRKAQDEGLPLGKFQRQLDRFKEMAGRVATTVKLGGKTYTKD